MKFLLLTVMLTVCAASPQDLSGKMFTFPQQSNTARVQLNTTREKFYAATVCLRFITDLRRDHILFSLATPSADNSFMIFRYAARDAINVFILDISAAFTGQDYMLNMWHSMCSTWDSRSGLAQLWFDGQPWTRKYVSPGSHISGHAIIFLGQEQNSHGGGFEINKSFVGMISDVHMWDYTLSPCEIREYMDELNFTPGNILNWSALEFQITDRVLIEDKPKAMYC
ncbi:C-reactive protein-like [Plectropomus leopardus]|uniref:C-reactive protein-like n=1 Tax=Plectropomus leopardus TaxID=160734 RepID=UPI001C4C7FE9|nr:C-reactive protein-like [Plectropomus leopardus]XP_042345070.1 C-reactive protein-like [Plectropomus leopardus]